MENQLKKAIDLSRITGDRLIVYDLSQNTSPFVVLSLDEYEKLVIGGSEVRNLTEDELLDKINRDIAIWKSEQKFDSQASSPTSSFLGKTTINWPKKREFEPIGDILTDSNYQEQNDDKYDNISDIDELENGSEKPGGRRNSWAIPQDRKDAAEEIIEEDRQYLESV